MSSINLATLRKSVPHITEGDENPRVNPESIYTYKDIKLDLEMGDTEGNIPANKPKNNTDILDLRDTMDIKQSLLNILNTTPGQKLLNPNFGLNLTKFAFDPITEQTADLIARTLLLALPEWEPRIQITNMSVIGMVVENEYRIKFAINFTDVNIDNITLQGNLNTDGFMFTRDF